HRVRINGELVRENISGSVTSKVPVTVLREIDRRRLVARRLIVDDQSIVVRQCISDPGTERPRVAFFQVCTRVIERESHALLVSERCRAPNDFVEPAEPTVQAVRAVIDGEAVGRPVESESPAGNPIAVASDDRAEVRRVPKISAQAVVSEYD